MKLFIIEKRSYKCIKFANKITLQDKFRSLNELIKGVINLINQTKAYESKVQMRGEMEELVEKAKRRR